MINSKVSHASIELEMAVEYMKRFHPELWDRVDDVTMIKILHLGQIMFKTQPEIIEATHQQNYLPTQ
jgi:hypothetical protein